MKTAGFTLPELLLVVAIVAVLVTVAVAYRMSDADSQLAKLAFQEDYRKAESLLIHARSLHAQGFRSSGDLTATQLVAATRGSDRHATAAQIATIVGNDHADDFKFRFAAGQIQVRFRVADGVATARYPLQRQQLAGGEDEVILSRPPLTQRSRILRVTDHLMAP